MPLLCIQTNQRIGTTEETSNLLRAASTSLAKALGKPEQACMVVLETAHTMLFAGSDEPCAFLELRSLGLPRDRTPELSAQLCGFIETHLRVDPARVYIHFQDVERPFWGNNRTTFG